MENKLAHLRLIQSVISRMAGNSFLIKGWSLTLASALFAIAADKVNINFAYLAYFPVLMFWLLDGYFSRQERLFRKLYDAVRTSPENAVDFSMDTRKVEDQVENWFCVCWSRTLAIFHGVIFSCVIVLTILLAIFK